MRYVKVGYSGNDMIVICALHLASVKELTMQLVAARHSRDFRFVGSYAGWTEMSIDTEADVDRALWLFRLNYDRITCTPINVLLRQVNKRVPQLG